MTGNRKLVSFLAFILITAIMRAPGWIEDSTYGALNELALWLFVGANAVEHLGPAAKDVMGLFGKRT